MSITGTKLFELAVTASIWATEFLLHGWTHFVTPMRSPARRCARVRELRSCVWLARALAFLALAQVILGGARLGPRRGAVGIELLLGDGEDAAVLAHLDDIEALRRILEHPVFAGELGGHALDRA